MLDAGKWMLDMNPLMLGYTWREAWWLSALLVCGALPTAASRLEAESYLGGTIFV
jgi:hypothetical protein